MKTSDTTLDVQEEVEFPGLFRPERISLLFAFLISLACFGLYTSCVGSVSMPGTPAASLTQIAGISPNLTSRYLPWRWLLAHLLPFFGDNLVYGANIISAAFGALSVGLLYLVVYATMSLAIGSEGLGATLKNPRVEVDRLSIVAGLFASAALAVSIPFWFSSTQVYPHAFYLFLMLLALYLLIRYMAYESKGSLLVFCLLWGLGMVQVGAFLILTPFVFWFLLSWIMGYERLRIGLFAGMLLCLLLGLSFFFLELRVFHYEEGFTLLQYPRFATLLTMALQNLGGDIVGGFQLTGWLIVFGMTILPFMAIFLVLRSSTDEDFRKEYLIVMLLMLVAALLNLFNTSVSVWRLFGERGLEVFPTAMVAVTFGFVVSIFYLQLRYWTENKYSANPRFDATDSDGSTAWSFAKKSVSVLWLVAMGVVVFWAGKENYGVVDGRQLGFVKTYVDKLLDEVEDDSSWLVTSGQLDDVIRLRAKERRASVRIINAANTSATSVETKLLLQQIEDPMLRRALGNGATSLIQEWLGSQPHVTDELVLTGFPDVWASGGFEVVSDGVVFRGIKPELYKAIATDGLSEAYRSYADALRSALGAADASASELVVRLAFRIRSATSLSGNNLAYMLERLGHQEEAFRLYAYVSDFDERNLSALLNYATLLEERKDSSNDEKIRVVERLNVLKADRRTMSAVAMTVTYGYLRWSAGVTQTGLDWALRGNDKMALHALNEAMALSGDDENQKQLLRRVMAEVSMRQNDFVATEMLYRAMLVEDPQNLLALLGLFDVSLILKKTEEAESLLTQLKSLDIPRQVILHKTAMLDLSCGRLDDALGAALDIKVVAPEYQPMYLLLSDIWMRKYEKAETEDEKAGALKEMKAATDELAYRAGRDDMGMLMSRARIAMVEGDSETARTLLLRVAGMTPNNLALLESVLRLDFKLADKDQSRQHATLILQRDPANKFANYVMALILFDDGKLDDAEFYLDRSVAAGMFPEAKILRDKIAAERERLVREKADNELTQR